MKNNKIKLVFFILKFFIVLFSSTVNAEEFNFDVTEVEITERGNKFKGIKRGTITVDNGIIINANEFRYNKITNILQSTSFESLQLLEKKFGFEESNSGKFFRKGQKNQWKNELNYEQIKKLENKFRDFMDKFGYD